MDDNKLYWHLIDEFGMSSLEATRLVGEIWSKVAELDLDYDIVRIEEIIREAM